MKWILSPFVSPSVLRLVGGTFCTLSLSAVLVVVLRPKRHSELCGISAAPNNQNNQARGYLRFRGHSFVCIGVGSRTSRANRATRRLEESAL